MKSRIAILMMLVFGGLMSTTGAGLAVSGLSGSDEASVAQYGTPSPAPTPTPNPGAPSTPGTGGEEDQAPQVLPEEDSGTPSPGTPKDDAPQGGVQPDTDTGDAAPSDDEPLQPSRQVEAGAQAGDDGELPFTGFAAIPILVGGVALLGTGAVLRRRTRDDA